MNAKIQRPTLPPVRKNDPWEKSLLYKLTESLVEIATQINFLTMPTRSIVSKGGETANEELVAQTDLTLTSSIQLITSASSGNVNVEYLYPPTTTRVRTVSGGTATDTTTSQMRGAVYLIFKKLANNNDVILKNTGNMKLGADHTMTTERAVGLIYDGEKWYPLDKLT